MPQLVVRGAGALLTPGLVTALPLAVAVFAAPRARLAPWLGQAALLGLTFLATTLALRPPLAVEVSSALPASGWLLLALGLGSAGAAGPGRWTPRRAWVLLLPLAAGGLLGLGRLPHAGPGLLLLRQGGDFAALAAYHVGTAVALAGLGALLARLLRRLHPVLARRLALALLVVWGCLQLVGLDRVWERLLLLHWPSLLLG